MTLRCPPPYPKSRIKQPTWSPAGSPSRGSEKHRDAQRRAFGQEDVMWSPTWKLPKCNRAGAMRRPVDPSIRIGNYPALTVWSITGGSGAFRLIWILPTNSSPQLSKRPVDRGCSRLVEVMLVLALRRRLSIVWRGLGLLPTQHLSSVTELSQPQKDNLFVTLATDEACEEAKDTTCPGGTQDGCDKQRRDACASVSSPGRTDMVGPLSSGRLGGSGFQKKPRMFDGVGGAHCICFPRRSQTPW
jgi:hypothetical protein